MKKGTFYGVGVGPGDPELITVKALRVIGQCPVVAAPRTKSGEMLALEIVQQAMPLEDREILPMDFSMDRDPAVREARYRACADQAAERLDAGLDVAMVNLGDVSLYATAGYIIDELDRRGYRTEMIPGITSFAAVAARLNISLTDLTEPVHIIPASSVDPEQIPAMAGTKILMKSASQLPKVLQVLKENGLLERTALAANCGLPGEVLVPRLSEDFELPEEAGYFTTLIIR